jgi:hypothetical protein
MHAMASVIGRLKKDVRIANLTLVLTIEIAFPSRSHSILNWLQLKRDCGAIGADVSSETGSDIPEERNWIKQCFQQVKDT